MSAEARSVHGGAAPPGDDAPRVSFVVAARNDDHGGGFLRRMQLFVTALLAQATRHGLRSELIIVEWNPPLDRPRLADALRWPARPGPCRVRIIEVQPWLHRRYQNSEKLPLFQMIAKNVGIRRARGRYVVCTNIDIVFSDGLIRALASGALDTDRVYRIDRLDVPADVPAEGSIDGLLEYCRKNVIRVHTRWGTYRAGKLMVFAVARRFVERRLVHIPYDCAVALRRRRRCVSEAHSPGQRPSRTPRDGLASAVVLATGRRVRELTDWLRRDVNVARGGQGARLSVPKVAAWIVREMLFAGRAAFVAPWAVGRVIVRTIRRAIPPHMNSAGDFTMVAREHWHHLRGYPEWAMYSLHIDSVFIWAAVCSGLGEIVLKGNARAYHIDHDAGWSPGGAEALSKRLAVLGVPVITGPVYRAYIGAMRHGNAPVIFNDENWGLGAEVLPETEPDVPSLVRPSHLPAGRPAARA